MSQDKETIVVLNTTLGSVKIKLYNETVKHKENFLKLAQEGQYNGLLFHRVIKEFMVQGGDVTSKDAPIGKHLGAGDLGYTVEAEFVYPQYFHKRGAVAAARTGDEVNPQRASSASQFYIVTGKVYTDAELDRMEKQNVIRLQNEIFGRLKQENKARILELQRNKDRDELMILQETLLGKMELETEKRKDEAKFTPEQREAYTTTGGVPFLDNQYTVYGEVVEGMDVVEKIENAETNQQDRPLQNIAIESVEIL
ncbi:MAG: peptidylprolyl isomerase [Tannerellaceae bacterium]|nr:peptidylprolyl isomerase [Tannerellaceae bacterium]